MYKKVIFLSLVLIMANVYAADLDDAFTQEYINDCSFHDEDEASLCEYAPPALKEWIQDVQDGKNPQPALLHGPYGIGKTYTARAVVKRSGSTFFNLWMPNLMQPEFKERQVTLDRLEKVEGDVCVVVDNVTPPYREEDVANMQSLFDFCQARNRFHLLMIATNASKAMPQSLFDRFRKIKFPFLSSDSQLKLMKHFSNEIKFADDVTDEFLQDFCNKPHMTPRRLKLMLFEAQLEAMSFEDNDQELIVTAQNLQSAHEAILQSAQELALDLADEGE